MAGVVQGEELNAVELKAFTPIDEGNEIEKFADIIRRFQWWILHGEDTGEESARNLLKFLLDLYRSALDLPSGLQCNPADASTREVIAVSDEEWKLAARSVHLR